MSSGSSTSEVPTIPITNINNHAVPAVVPTTNKNHNGNNNNNNNMKDSIIQLSAGALAGAASRTGTAPLERLKILYQVQTTKPPSVITGIINMYNSSGLRGMWKGNAANVLKIAPESAVKFFMFEKMKTLLGDSPEHHLTATELFLCGSVAGITSHATLFPMEVIKTRLAVSENGVYRGITDCAVKTLKYEGIWPFYRGLTASLMSTIPHAGTNLMLYEVMKKFLRPKNSEVPSVLGLMAAGAVSSAVSQVVVYPVRTIKARMIMNGMPGQAFKEQYSGGVLDIARATMKHEGFRGFFKGFYPSLLKTVPANMITFTVYDTLRRVFGIEKKKKHDH